MRNRALPVLVAAAAVLTAWFAFRGDGREPRFGRSARRPAPQTPAATDPVGSPSPSPAGEPVDLDAVDRERDLHGIVVRAEDGTPVAGALLETESRLWNRLRPITPRPERLPGPRTRSAPDGTFGIPLEPADLVDLRVTADGFATLGIPNVQAGERLRIEMAASVRLVVHVRDADGQPVVGARLSLTRPDWEGDLAFEREGVTDAGGRRAFAGLPPSSGAYLMAQHAALGSAGSLAVALPATGEKTVELTLPGGRAVNGRVSDAETGAAIARARVGKGELLLGEVLTDESGRFALHGWTGKDAWDIHVLADGYGRTSREVADHPVLDFELERGDSVTGRLVGPDGEPVTGARVTAIGWDHSGMDSRISCASGRADAQGRFRLQWLRRDRAHTLLVVARGFGRCHFDFAPRSEGPGTIDLGDIELPLGRTIAGRVLHASGEPVPRLWVDLSGVNGDRLRMLRKGYQPSQAGYPEGRLTDDLGRFRFPDLAPASYVLNARIPNGPEANAEVDLGDTDLADVVLRMPDGRFVTVEVVDEQGQPVPEAFVNLSVGKQVVHGPVDARGRARLFAAGRLKGVSVDASRAKRDFLSYHAALESQESPVRVVLREGTWIRGRVVDPESRPVAGAWIEVRRNGKPFLSDYDTDTAGRFAFKVPKAQRFDIVIQGVKTADGLMDAMTYGGRLDDVPSGATDVLLRLERRVLDRTQPLRVEYPDGSPAAGAPISCGPRREMTGPDGRFTFEKLPAVEMWIGAYPPPGRTDLLAAASVRRVPDGKELVFRFTRAATIRGRVLLRDDQPASGVQVKVHRGAKSFQVTTARDGSFAVRVPAEGEGAWTIVARGEDGTEVRADEVRPGDGAVQLKFE